MIRGLALALAANATATNMTIAPAVPAPTIHLEFQYRQVNIALAIAYGGACFFASWAFLVHRQSPVRQTATLGFYLFLALASFTRVVWFASPLGVLSVAMEPPRIKMGDDGWQDFLVTEAVELLGSYLFYSVFVLTIVFWADMLRRLFSHDHARSHPVRLFLLILGALLVAQALGFAFFMAQQVDSYWLLMYDDIEMLLFSMSCLIALTVYSYRMTTVLRAFLEVSQIDTSDRISAVNWATSICSVFLVFNGGFFLTYSIASLASLHRVDMLLEPKTWWIFVVSKHLLEVLSIYLLLYSLWGKSNEDEQRRNGYEPISDASDDEVSAAAGSTGSPKRA